MLGPLQAETEAMGWSLSGELPKSPQMLCKFEGRLTPAQMRQDLTFDIATDNQPYREHAVVW